MNTETKHNNEPQEWKGARYSDQDPRGGYDGGNGVFKHLNLSI